MRAPSPERKLAAAKKTAARGEAVVGKPHPHDSAELHVTGRAIYIDDMPEPEGLLHIAPGYAGSAACGRITAVDLSAVEAFPGVVAVLTAKDIPGRNDCSSPGARSFFTDRWSLPLLRRRAMPREGRPAWPASALTASNPS